MWTHGSSFGGGGILTSDNHNSLYTRATVSSPSPCPLRRPSRFALLALVRTRRSLLPSLSSLFSSLLRRVVSSPLVPRSSCRIDHGYSAIVFDLSCSCCGCRLQGEFRVPSVTTYFTGVFILLSFSFAFSRSFSSLFIPLLSRCCLAPRVGIYFSRRRTFLRTFAFPPTFHTSFHSRNGHRNS